MMKIVCRLVIALVFSSPSVFGQQYVLNGSAYANSCNCYTLTTAQTHTSGSAWNNTLFDLSNSFDFRFSVFLGCQDAAGADGMVFMLQQASTGLGGSGGGLGFGGVSPSVGIILDTWQNTDHDDPAYDHISIQVNGVLVHGTDLAGPVQASATNPNIEDCRWHLLRITWDAVGHRLRAYFDGVLRVESQVDLVTTIFNNNPSVYWGFSAATGGNYNLQQFCTALAPQFSSGFSNNATCIGTPVTFANNSESFAPITAYHWDFGDGTTYTVPNPPPHLYAQPGEYEVKLAVKGFDGCDSDTLVKIVRIGDYPTAGFQVVDTCMNKAPRIVDESVTDIGMVAAWNWELNNQPVSTAQLPQLQNLQPGNYSLRLSVENNSGCASTNLAEQTFTILPAPVVEIGLTNGCINEPISFAGIQADGQTVINAWEWQLGNGSTADQQNVVHSYGNAFAGNIALTATATNGCQSATVTRPLRVNEIAVTAAGSDTLAIPNQPFQLQAAMTRLAFGSVNDLDYSWTPANQLHHPSAATTTGILGDDETFTVTVTTPEGCTAIAQAPVTLFKGSAIYVPTAFTPNQDGLNDFLKPLYIGIEQLDYFIISNRWGQPVFSTRSLYEQWNGFFQQQPQPAGVYVWQLSAVDFAGKRYNLKGSITLIR